jgi:Ca-activated chloride channel family protein
MDLQSYGILNPAGALTVVFLLIILLLDWRTTYLRTAARTILGLPQAHSVALRRCIIVFISLLLGAAILRPFWGAEDVETQSSGSDVIFLVDISRSMYAQDVPPSRLELAKRKMKDLIQNLALTGLGDRFGITVFAGDGYTVCPVTNDRGVLAQFIDILSPDLVTSLGSNLKAGVSAAIGRLDEVALRHSHVILISDGEDNFLDQTSLITEITKKGVRFDVLGVGTPSGGTITLPNGATVIDASRRPVLSTLNEASLQAIAQAGGGTYLRATLDDSDVQALSAPKVLPGVERATHTSHVRTYREIGPWLVLVALGTFICCALSRRANPLLLLPLFVLAPHLTSLHAETPRPAEQALPFVVQSPFDLYQKGDYAQAVDAYSKAIERNPNDRALHFGLASSLYKLGRHEESVAAFRKLADSAPNGREYFENTYNEGNALLALGRYSDAIDAYWRALDVKPDDPAASHNLAVARALLEEQKRATPTPTPTPTASPESSKEPQPSPTAENSPSPQDESDRQKSETPPPSPSAAQTETPSDEQKSTPAASPSGSPSPAASSSPPSTESTSTPDASVSPSPAPSETLIPTPTPSDRLKESLEPTGAPEPPSQSSPAPEASAALPEADAWLESLPDSPLLIRKHRGTPASDGQTW